MANTVRSLTALCALAALCALTACSRAQRYGSEDQLLTSFGGFVAIGRFDLVWPATVVGVDEGEDAITFQHAGTPHEYSGYAGYSMRAVHLDADGKAGVLVLRAKERRPAAAPR